MSQSRYGRTLCGIALAGALASTMLWGCTGAGDTDGGQGNDAAGIGSQVVSNGGFGAGLTIQIKGETPDVTPEIETGGTRAFFVVATDPAGAPLAFRRVFCESEKGIAILEPSSGGVAFEHTGPDGSMSGLLGGVTPGSYIIECRLEEGFNLVARRRLKVSGEVPAGFAGFPGAAGGNLGGGSIQPNPNLTVDLLQILFNGQGLTDDPNGPIDTELWTDCNFDGLATLSDIEPYTYDEYKLKIKNSFNEPLQIESVQFIIHDGREVTSDPRQLTGLYIGTGDTGEVVGTFTEPVQAAPYIKAFAGTTSTVIDGTYNVEFIVKGTTLSGESFTISNTGSVTFGGVNNC